MGMDFRRLILVFIFSLSIMMLWGEWQKEANKLNKPAATATVPAQPAAPGSVPVPSANAPTPTAVPGAPGASVATAAPANTSQKLRIKTDVLVADLDSQGGDLRYLEFLKHKDTLDKTKNFILLEYQGTHTYIAQTGLVAANAQLPTHQSQFAFVAGPTELKDGQTTLAVRLEATTPSAKVTKVYTFTRGSYVVDVAYEVTNLSGQPIAPQAYTQLVRDNKAPKGDSTFLQTYTGMAMFTEANKYQKQDFKDIEKKKEIPTKTADNGWIGIIQHYFATAWIPEGKAPREFYTRAEANNLFSAGMLTQVGTIAPNATGTFKAKLYAGPTDQDVMKTIAPGLDLTVDYGWLTILAQPMFWLLKFLHGMTNNWGWAIVLLTVVIKAAFFPLSAASYKSMALNGNTRALRQRPHEDEPSNDGAVQDRKDQPARWLFADRDPNSGVYRALLGVAGLGGNPPPAVGVVDSRPDRHRPLLRAARHHGGVDVHPNQDEPHATRPDPGKGDDVHADRVLGVLLLLPGRLGAVLGGEQYPVDCPAVANYPHDRARGG
jgi:YidC/Oxa1 family membrane protein insertase